MEFQWKMQYLPIYDERFNSHKHYSFGYFSLVILNYKWTLSNELSGLYLFTDLGQFEPQSQDKKQLHFNAFSDHKLKTAFVFDNQASDWKLWHLH